MRVRLTTAVAIGMLILATSAVPAGASGPPVGIPLACGGAGPYVAHPKEFAFSCDGNVVFTNVHWSRWGSPVAHGTATLWLVTSCTPNCAQAPRHKYLAKITASNIVYCGKRPVYGTIVARFGKGSELSGSPIVCSG